MNRVAAGDSSLARALTEDKKSFRERLADVHASMSQLRGHNNRLMHLISNTGLEKGGKGETEKEAEMDIPSPSAANFLLGEIEDKLQLELDRMNNFVTILERELLS